MAKSKKHKAIEWYTGFKIPHCFVKDIIEAKNTYENWDRSTLEKECTRLFAYIKVSEAYIDELETKLIKMI